MRSCAAQRDVGQRRGVRHPPQELVGDQRVDLGPVALVAGERAGLVPDGVGDGDPAEVVDQRGGLGVGSARLACQRGDGP